MHKLIIRSVAIAVALVFAAGAAPAVVFAHDGEDHADSHTSTSGRNAGETDRLTTVQTTASERRETVGKRLEAAKLKVCEQRAKTIGNIMTRGVTRGEKQVELFDTIAERVKTFYANKGKVLSTYDELVAAVDAAKSKAQTALDQLKTHNFSCDSDDPKGQAADFKKDLQALNTALKDYRTAVINLIVGVKSVQSTVQPEGARQ